MITTTRKNRFTNKNQLNFITFSFIALSGLILLLATNGCDFSVESPGSEITDTIPEHGETGVATDTTISITFNKTALPQTFSLGLNPDFVYDKTWTSDNATILIKPSEDLFKSTSYLITIASVTFDDNSSLTQPVSFSFDTVFDESHPPAPLALSPENIETVESISDSMDKLIERGIDSQAICEQVVEMLADDNNVKTAGTDEENNAVWVDFNDGEVQIFQVTDSDEEEYGDTPDNAFLSVDSKASSLSLDPIKIHAAAKESAASHYYLPANNKALLANSLQTLHPEKVINDSTDDVKEMLTDRGYDVTRHPLSLDDFKQLGDYGVILLETHGIWRPLASYNANVLDVLSTQHVLLTATRITGDNFPPDIHSLTNDSSSLVSWTAKQSLMTVNGVTMVHTMRNYGVTAEYVRQNVTKFTDKTVFFLNGCSGMSNDIKTNETVSPFKDVFFEKCDKGPLFIGWKGKTSFYAAVRTALHFYQYATASNKEIRAFGQTISGAIVEETLLKKFDVPWGGYNMTAQSAYDAVKAQPSITTSKFKGTFQIETKGSDTYKNILMPHPRYVEFDEDGDHTINMLADSNPEITVGGTKCTLTSEPDYPDTWDIKMPSGAYGDLIVTENNRKSIPRKVYRWWPKIKIKGGFSNSDGQNQYTANLSVIARATVNESSLRISPLDELPTAGFSAEWDKSASNISWESSGSFVSGSKTTQVSGSGLRAFGESEYGDLKFDNDSGFSIFCSICIEEKSTYTEPLIGTYSIDGCRGITFQRYDQSGEASGMTSDWTVNAQSFDNFEGYDDYAPGLYTLSEMISWGAVSPDPRFDNSLEPR